MDKKNWEQHVKNGRRLALNVGCHLENLRPLSKLDLHPKSLCLKRPWNSNKPSSLVMEGKNITTQQKVLKAQMWAITKIVTFTLNHDHWLLFNGLTITIT
jgi:hypothetical protein